MYQEPNPDLSPYRITTQTLQKEFKRLDKDKSGTIGREELEEMAHAKLKKNFNINWDKVIEECDQNGNGEIDF